MSSYLGLQPLIIHILRRRQQIFVDIFQILCEQNIQYLQIQLSQVNMFMILFFLIVSKVALNPIALNSPLFFNLHMNIIDIVRELVDQMWMSQESII